MISIYRNYREFSEQHGITRLLGEYRARCLFSKTWVLRDAATLKVQLMLSDELEREGISSCLPSLAGEGLCRMICIVVERSVV